MEHTIYGPLRTTYICWLLPSGSIVCTERDGESEPQTRELAEHVNSVIFFFSDENLEVR